LRSDSAIVPREHVPLRPFSTLGVGGTARWFVTAERPDDVAAAHRWAVEQRVPIFVLGGGSNLVIADEGFDGLVLHIGIRGLELSASDEVTRVIAGAGESWDRLVSAVVEQGLAGVECLSGIPGTVGGTPIQNVGAYGQDVSATIEHVVVFDTIERRTRTLASSECGFAYRMSRFKGEDAGRFIVCEVAFCLRHGRPTTSYADVSAYFGRMNVAEPTVADVRNAILEIRRRKGMVIDAGDPDTRSVGSFFMNPVVTLGDRARIASATGEDVPGFASGASRVKIPAAWLIERAGFGKGYGDGTVGISTKHPLAIVNRGDASARDVVRFAASVKRGVADRFGVWLRPEPVFVGFANDSVVEFLQRADH
jgi:UDP-N-acetylmuramate dehydrogenase